MFWRGPGKQKQSGLRNGMTVWMCFIMRSSRGWHAAKANTSRNQQPGPVRAPFEITKQLCLRLNWNFLARCRGHVVPGPWLSGSPLQDAFLIKIQCRCLLLIAFHDPGRCLCQFTVSEHASFLWGASWIAQTLSRAREQSIHSINSYRISW